MRVRGDVACERLDMKDLCVCVMQRKRPRWRELCSEWCNSIWVSSVRIRNQWGSTGQQDRACGVEAECERWQVVVEPVPIQCRLSPDEPLTAYKRNKSHCVERNSDNAFTSFKRWIGISYQSWEAHTLSCEWLDMYWFARMITLLMTSSVFCSNYRMYLNIETWKMLSPSAFHLYMESLFLLVYIINFRFKDYCCCFYSVECRVTESIVRNVWPSWRWGTRPVEWSSSLHALTRPNLSIHMLLSHARHFRDSSAFHTTRERT